MTKNVVLIVAAPFGKRDYDRYGVEILKSNGFIVHIWNLSYFLYPKTRQYILADALEEDIVCNFETAQEVIKSINSLPKIDFVYTTVGCEIKTYRIFQTISKRKYPYCVIGLNANLPFHNYATPLMKRLNEINFEKLFRYFFNRLPLKLLDIEPASYVTVIGNKCSLQRREVESSTKLLYTHSHDFDLYLKESKGAYQETNTAVFLDNYLPFHPDSLYSGEKNPVTADLYHLALNQLFHKIEQQFDLEVIIAAHPKADYSGLNNPFGNRKIFKNQTVALVKKSQLVILNFSTSVNFAVLFKKPFIVFTTSELNDNGYKSYIEQFASLFGKVPVNIQEDYTLEKDYVFSQNNLMYDEYRNAYIKTEGSPEKYQWQIISDEINKITS